MSKNSEHKMQIPDHNPPSMGGLAAFNSAIFTTSYNLAMSKWLEWFGLLSETSRFMEPYWNAAQNFMAMQEEKKAGAPSWESAMEFMELLMFDMQLASRAAAASVNAMNQYHGREAAETLTALSNMMLNSKVEDYVRYSERKLKIVDTVVNTYPRVIRDIEPEYGFHFDGDRYVKIAETDRFTLYQVLPTVTGMDVKTGGKPTLIIPPYVLGANILALLPAENRSYVHAFANQGIPTYIRIVKPIAETPAVQTLTGEDDALDTRYFCEKILERQGSPVTLNGYCQGGFLAALHLLSGELDGLADALITCVAPMDGTCCRSLSKYMESLPDGLRDPALSYKRLPSGNEVVDGKVLGWIFKLRSIERDAPILTFYRDLAIFGQGANDKAPEISKASAAIGHWLTYDRTDIPVGITKLSYDSFTNPISKDGTLPIKLFGRALNFKRLKEKDIKWLLCIAEGDDLIDKEAALAPLAHVDAEVVSFPKGHVAIATSWCFPASECSLDMDFFGTACSHGQSRGPVRFQLDLDQAIREKELAVYWDEMEDRE